MVRRGVQRIPTSYGPEKYGLLRDAVGVRWTPLPRTSTALRPEKYPIFQSRDALRRWATAPRPHTRRIHAGRAWPRPAESRHSPPTLASSSSSPAHWVRCRGAAAWSGGTAAPRQWQSFDSAGKCWPIPQVRCDDRDTLHVPGAATASLRTGPMGPLAPKPARPARWGRSASSGSRLDRHRRPPFGKGPFPTRALRA